MARANAAGRDRPRLRQTPVETPPPDSPLSYLVDTNVLSELRKGARTNDKVRAWFSRVADEELFISVVAIGEIRRGIDAIRRRDLRHAASLEHWLRRLVVDHGDRLLPVDLAWPRSGAV